MGSPSLFKFTKGEVEAKKIIRMAQRKHLVAYLQVTSMGSLDLRVEGKEGALLAISFSIMRRSVQIEGTHHLMMTTIIRGASSRNDKYNGKGKGMQVIKEMTNSSINKGTSSMKNQMLLLIIILC